ncbi:glycosyltransferase [Rubidibacter lacunae KORDI 51-2]|uniref:Glycosyltransferase n=1 Tax=Rubidibacter lacunae KORDI 51-2 TaxID=582515 RepID=U5DB21_9CHRO|nr:glycosyltransferase family 4 protein [Rubidibacter lacunae]ERN41743.1 glycosyltransferase [Rubidibacter lacunae KORDI 51-2]
MRILFAITRSDTVGGAQLHVHNVASALSESGHAVLVVTGTYGPYNDFLEKSGIQSRVCPTLKNNINPLQDLQTLAFLRGAIRDFQPNLVSTHSSKTGILGRLAAKQTGTPVIFTAHGWSFADGVPEPKRTIYKWLEQWAIGFTDRLICVSEWDRQLGMRTAGMPPGKLIKIHRSVQDVPKSWRAEPGSGNPVKVVMVARFELQKDHITILKAIKDLEGVQLDFIGDGPTKDGVRLRAHALGIAHKVNFLGFCTDVSERLKDYHIFALITNWEGFPTSTLEAMRAGLPVVVSDVCGASEAIVEGETGFSIPHGDADTLRKRLRELIENRDRRVAMGKAARSRYECEYTFSMMMERTLAAYREALVHAGSVAKA